MVNLEENTDQAEYQKILNGLTKNMTNICSTDAFNDGAFNDKFDDELDQDIIKSISESLQYADVPSDTILSDIPVVIAPKKTLRKKNVNKKSIIRKPINKTK